MLKYRNNPVCAADKPSGEIAFSHHAEYLNEPLLIPQRNRIIQANHLKHKL
jgi:hypothetical protein